MRREPIRVLHLIETLGPWGAQQVLLTVVRALDRERVSSVVASLFGPMDLASEFEAAGASVLSLGLGSPYDWRRGIVGLSRELKRRRIEVLHTHLLFANLHGRLAARLAGTPCVVTTLHSCDYSYQDTGSWRFKAGKWLDRVTARRNAATVAVSNAVRDDYQRQLGLRGVDVLYNCVDPQRYAGSWADARQSRRAAFGFRDNDLVIVMTGRLHSEKGQRTLIDALAIALPSAPTLSVVLVGAGSDEEMLRACAAARGVQSRVRFAGSHADVRPFLAMADLFVLPSNLEGLPIALLEAMAMGVPSIATTVGGTPEVIEQAMTGLLVPPRNAQALASAIAHLAQDRATAARLGRAGQEAVERRFSTSAQIPRLEALYARVAGAEFPPRPAEMLEMAGDHA